MPLHLWRGEKNEPYAAVGLLSVSEESLCQDFDVHSLWHRLHTSHPAQSQLTDPALHGNSRHTAWFEGGLLKCGSRCLLFSMWSLFVGLDTLSATCKAALWNCACPLFSETISTKVELQATGLVHKCFHFFILTDKGKLLVLCKTFAISNPMFCARGGDNVRVDTFGAFFLCYLQLPWRKMILAKPCVDAVNALHQRFVVFLLCKTHGTTVLLPCVPT